MNTVFNFNSPAEKQELFSLMCKGVDLNDPSSLTGTCLQALRLSFGLSLEHLADESKVSVDAISAYEAGQEPRIADLENILWVYGISPIMFMSLVECFKKTSQVYLRMVNGKFTGEGGYVNNGKETEILCNKSR